MYTALYRTERPETFDEILGQEHIVKILRNQVKTGTVGHAYLFCGTRGTGKTSTARILAKAVNCTGEGEKPCGVCPNCQAIKNGAFIDMIEIDAASNNGVDNVRELRESVNYPPAVGQKKVYIIDEAHMLTAQALNALLKTLEEPPENVMFILATTDPQKLLQTILSRCLRLDFRRIPDSKIAEHMQKICNERGVEITPDALRLLASNADGSVRDGLSLLDQCLSGGGNKLDRDTVLEYLGTVADDFFIKLTDMINAEDAASGILLLDEVLRDGKDVKQLVSDWLSHYRSLLVSKYVDNPENILNLSSENVAKLVDQSHSMNVSEIERGILTLSRTVNDVRYSSQPRILMELAIVMLAGGFDDTDVRNKAVVRAAAPAKAATPAKAPVAASTPAPAKEVAPAPTEEVAPASSEQPPEAPSEASEQPPEAPSENLGEIIGENLNDIWEAVWERVGARGTMMMARLNSYLAGISDTDFKVIFTNKYGMEQAEKSVEAFVDAMQKETGKLLKMVTVFSEPEESTQQSFLGEEPSTPKESSEPQAEEKSLPDEAPSASEDAPNDEGMSDEEFEAMAKALESEYDIKVRIE